MKPRKLKIEGLNSFVEPQEIDFSRLTEKGFFGIFGPTGSGKSTILDAMTLALYGEIPRSGKKNEFINSFKKDMNVVYEFEIGGALDRKTYSVERHYKRKKDGGILCDRALLVELTDNVDEIIAEGSNAVLEEIIAIIGLKCDDFTRSVVLPQGKFSEFLKLTKGDRGKMLERILSLEEFGSKMVAKLKQELSARGSELERINGALGGFKDTSDEALELKKLELSSLLKEEKLLKQEKDRIEAEYKKYSEIWELQKELELFENRKQELEKNHLVMDAKKNRLDRGTRASAVKPFIDSVIETEEKIRAGNSSLQQLKLQYLDMEKKLADTTLRHEQALRLKDEKVQPLTAKETELAEALKLEQELLTLDKELDGLREEYDRYNRSKLNLEKLIGENQSEKEKSHKIVEENEERIKAVKVSPGYRDKIAKALLIEREFYDATNKLKKTNMAINELGAHLVHQNTLLITIGNEKEGKEKTLFDAVERKNILDKSNPESAEKLVAMQMQLKQMEASMEELDRNTQLSARVSFELKEIVNTAGEADKKLERQVHENFMMSKEMEALKLEIEISRKKSLAAILAEELKEGEPCPVCGAQHHPHQAKMTQEYVDQLQKNHVKLAELEERLEYGLKQENTSRMELAGYETGKKLKEEQIRDIRLQIEGLGLSEYKAAKDRLEVEYKLLKEKSDKYTREAKDLDEQLVKLKDEVHEAITKFGIARAEFEKDMKQREVLKKEQEEEKASFDAVDKKYGLTCSELGIQDIQAENDRIINNALVEERLRTEQEQQRKRMQELELIRSNLENQKTEVLAKLESIKTTGVERRRVKDDYSAKINQFTEGKNPKEYYDSVVMEKKRIIETEAKLKKEYEDEKNTMSCLSDEKMKAENNLTTLSQIISESRAKLEHVLKKNSFANMEEALGSMLSAESMKQHEAEIKSYTDELKSAVDNVIRINNRLKGEHIDNVNWEKLLSDRKSNEEARESNTGTAAACKAAIARMTSDLEQMRQLVDQRKLVVHQVDMLEDISKLVAGNKFVEFAAANQLKHIAREASRRLGEITRGRYALELDSSNEFVMRDDYSGGLRRSADTLSGGETFLTSLCLALALSSNLQLKGRSPLEFFFLDEGFGTLDSELLEVVMSSLERLRNDRLCVGIISHVEELKNRVPVKLMVNPATMDGEGTRVSIEYS